MMSETGQCLCGAIQYRIDNAPQMAGVCHCKNCQRQAGSAFSTLAGVPTTEFHLIQGELKLYTDTETESGNAVQRFFCGNCGSPIYSAVPGFEGMVFLKTGTMDDTSGFTPQFHAWGDTKQNWVAITDGAPVAGRNPG